MIIGKTGVKADQTVGKYAFWLCLILFHHKIKGWARLKGSLAKGGAGLKGYMDRTPRTTGPVCPSPEPL